jgi:hypothetical protein
MSTAKAVPAKATPAPKPQDIFIHEIALYPGRPESYVRGCMCPVEANAERDGTAEKPFIVEDTCPVHEYVLREEVRRALK